MASPRVTVLLGSGVSIEAHLPGTEEVTKRVTGDDEVWRHTDGCYCSGSSRALPTYENHVYLVRKFLRRIGAVVTSYYRDETRGAPTYEDLYFVAEQVADCESREYDNPAVGPLAEQLRKKLEPILRRHGEGSEQGLNFACLATETCNYIADTVCRALRVRVTAVPYLEKFVNALMGISKGSLTLVTLNHDTVLETALEGCRVVADDGFVPDGDVRRWEPSGLVTPHSGVKLVKLHGSLNWYWFEVPGPGEKEVFFGSVTGGQTHILRLANERGVFCRERPSLLIGTHNKILDYTRGPFLCLFHTFVSELDRSDRLVVCGYGFKDKGVNGVLANWLLSGTDRRLVVIHRNPRELAAGARPAIASRWAGWLESGRLRVIEKWVEDVREGELAEALA